MRPNSFNKLNLLAIETEEIYRHIYRDLPSEGDINLLAISQDFEPESVRKLTQSYDAHVILLGTGHVDAPFLSILSDVKVSLPAAGLAIIFSSCESGDLKRINDLLKHRDGGTAVYLKQSLGSLNALDSIIHSAALGQLNVDSALVNSFIDMKPESLLLKQLTEREREILDLLAHGFTNSGIAKSLFLDNKTVENHINNIYTKLKTDEEFDGRHPRVTVARRYLHEVGSLRN